MAELINQIKAQVAAISSDIDKIDNKAASARVRKATLRLEKLGQAYRKESIGCVSCPCSGHGRPIHKHGPASVGSFGRFCHSFSSSGSLGLVFVMNLSHSAAVPSDVASPEKSHRKSSRSRRQAST